jgi:hypothetical protein
MMQTYTFFTKQLGAFPFSTAPLRSLYNVIGYNEKYGKYVSIGETKLEDVESRFITVFEGGEVSIGYKIEGNKFGFKRFISAVSHLSKFKFACYLIIFSYV